MLTSKQRAYLKSLANSIKQANDALLARELVKGKVLETVGEKPKEIAAEIAQSTESEVVLVIGSKFILYKKNKKEPKIILPKVKSV